MFNCKSISRSWKRSLKVNDVMNVFVVITLDEVYLYQIYNKSRTIIEKLVFSMSPKPCYSARQSLSKLIATIFQHTSNF